MVVPNPRYSPRTPSACTIAAPVDRAPCIPPATPEGDTLPICTWWAAHGDMTSSTPVRLVCGPAAAAAAAAAALCAGAQPRARNPRAVPRRTGVQGRGALGPAVQLSSLWCCRCRSEIDDTAAAEAPLAEGSCCYLATVASGASS